MERVRDKKLGKFLNKQPLLTLMDNKKYHIYENSLTHGVTNCTDGHRCMFSGFIQAQVELGNTSKCEADTW